MPTPTCSPIGSVVQPSNHRFTVSRLSHSIQIRVTPGHPGRICRGPVCRTQPPLGFSGWPPPWRQSQQLHEVSPLSLAAGLPPSLSARHYHRLQRRRCLPVGRLLSLSDMSPSPNRFCLTSSALYLSPNRCCQSPLLRLLYAALLVAPCLC